MLVVCAPLSAVPAFADEGDGDTEPQNWAICGNFAFTLPQGAMCETLDSADVDSALQESGPFSGAIDQGALCRIDASDETAVYVYACRALIDADDVAWANNTTDEIALQERGEWFARQLVGSDALLTTAVRYVGCLYYDVEEQPLTFFCFSNYLLRVGCVMGFVPLPSGYVSTIAFAFELSQSAGAMSVVDGVIPSLEVGDGYTTPEMIEAEFEKDYTLSEDELALSGMTHGDKETGPYKDGYYESYTRDWGSNSSAVCLQVTDGKVAAVEASDDLTYLDFGADAVEQLPSAIVAANGIEGVDVVSGATLTSQIILYAAEDCLVQATACPFDEAAREGLSPQDDVDFRTCYRCHDDDLDTVNHAPSERRSTEDQVIDPHAMPDIDAHVGLNITCGDCHSVDGSPTMVCAQCHDGMVEVPEGWTTPEVKVNAMGGHRDAVPIDACASCHDGTVACEFDMAGVEAKYTWNDDPFNFHSMSDEVKTVHESFVEDFSCQTCHAEKSVAACASCHAGVFTRENLPWGWIASDGNTDGFYTAEGKGIGGKVPVTVAIENGRITDVEVGDNSETQGIGSKAIEQLPDAIVAANGTEGVDAVSGATVTSKAIFTAVEDCLAQAQGGAAEQAAPAEDAKADEKAEPAAEEKAEEKADTKDEKAADTKDAKADDKAADAKADEKADDKKADEKDAKDDKAAEGYADGSYTAEGKGIGGKVPVTVTVKGGKVSEVTVGDNSETQGIGSKAIEQLPAKIVEANGLEGVDAVSGATVTSKAIFTAVDDCLEQAKGGAAAEAAKADDKVGAAPAAETTYTDGEYTAYGKGIGGDVPVTVTVRGGKVAEVTVGDNSETQGIGSKAIEQLPDAIVAANGTEGVDAVSGATVTSKAIFSAVEDCLEQAMS